ncbi:metallophosphoesterase [Pseudomonas viridiflava]|uniref:metallophosphoesterase n=1 Tax=Pseudomonas viridiflava TaxID=33069 RepID=UPI000F039CA8|nr:metallophosphoesterase [Pseudomonas viridiflava]
MKKVFRWLHLSDLHVGQKGQSWLWPNVKTIFLEDLAALLHEIGTIDAVIFSGDLTQKGSVEEYTALTAVLEEIWGVLLNSGSDPILFTIPGNHDLARPEDYDNPVAEVIRDWWTKPKARELFWAKDKNYYPYVCGAFGNYTNWIRKIEDHPFIRTAPALAGLLPGDTSVSLKLDQISVGFVGLNSAFLQLTGDDYEGKLDLNVQQLLAVTANDPAEWCLKHDVNLLVTHHPVSWIKDVAHFEEQIYHPGRFTAHLFGHLHEADDTTLTRGSSSRKSVQAASLFGLEYFQDGLVRSHGYSIGEIEFDGEGAFWKQWPRKSYLGRGNTRKFIADPDQSLERGKEYTLERLTIRDKSVTSKTVTPAPSQMPDLAAPSASTVSSMKHVLENTGYRLNAHPSHLVIRGLEQQTCCFTLKSHRIAWVVSDWGLGIDGFLYSVLNRASLAEQATYKVDLSNYSSREDFFSAFSTKAGCSFNEYCKILSASGQIVLILDEAPVYSDGPGMECEAMRLAKVVQGFCPDIYIFIVSRSTPKAGAETYIQLAPLDEADTRAYLVANPEATSEITSKSAVSDIYRFTEGVPGKIDRTIKQLRVVSLADLAGEMVADSKSPGLANEVVPASLSTAVDRLAHAKDDHARRSWELLKILSVLPSGEALHRIKYLAPRFTLRSEHAEELLELNLISVRVTSVFVTSSGDSKERFKVLFTPRQVRDYVLSILPVSDVDDITSRAITLYFGQNWRSGAAKLRAITDDTKSDDRSTLMNASVLSLRLLASAVGQSKQHAIKQAVTVCKAYCVHGRQSKHYRDLVHFCTDLFMILPPGVNQNDRVFFELVLANSLRMTGQGDRAIKYYEGMLSLKLDNADKKSVLLNYAFCMQDDDPDAAVDMAKQLIALDKHSFHALQAHALILEIEDEDSSYTKLSKIQKDARKRGATTAANNIALTLALGAPDSAELERSLMEVRATADKEQDYYNSARASIQIARMYSRRGTPLPVELFGDLIKAYQYLFGQRLSALFDSAHTLLWEEFEKSRDIPNLLTLFKHSSFNWRLENKEEKEKSYASRLLAAEKRLLKADIFTSDTDTTYFLSRSGKQLLLR